MTELTRRSLLNAGIAVSAASAFTPLAPPATPARATASAVGKQAPGFYRYKVGSFECTSINDGARSFLMPEGYIRNVPKEQALAAAEAAYMPQGMVTVPFNPQIINTGSKLVLIDTGYGPGVAPSIGLLSVAGRHGGCRNRSRSDRHRRSLAPAPRPHQRGENGGWESGLPECRDHGTHARLGILDE
jgi:hypothetical protein